MISDTPSPVRSSEAIVPRRFAVTATAIAATHIPIVFNTLLNIYTHLFLILCKVKAAPPTKTVPPL